MKLLLPFLILIFAASTQAQKNVAALAPAHAAALEKFLSSHKGYEFMSETRIDENTLKYMRKTWGKAFHPFYTVGNFNKDRFQDFALVLAAPGEVKPAEEGAEQDFPLALIVFNGSKKGFFQAYLENVVYPINCLLTIQDKKLTFGVDESDTGFFLTPTGKGYIKEYGEEP